MADRFLELHQIKKSFGRQTILNNLNLTVNRGDAVVIIGKSGEGKSVLLKHLIKLITPDEGEVRIEGENILQMDFNELSIVRRRFGMLFQSAALFDSMTVAENVGLGLKESRTYSKDVIDNIVMEKLSMVNLADAADKMPSELSGGMRKRAGLARAIAHSPEIMLYDEPTTGLDPITADMINNLIVNLNDRLNVTSVTVTHDMKSAFKIADRIVMLYQGKVAFDGSVEEVKNTTNAMVKQFITGSSEGPITE
ncbi:MAG: ABC transporter ATP-binding protein [Calditrichaeota bacterium]|nr:MAG: ABC transporter ATP-binding protein [Calditrichota bacterium]